MLNLAGLRQHRPRWLTAIVAMFAALILIVGLLHTSVARSAVLSWAVARLEGDLKVRVTAGGLEYNLLSLSASLHDVTIAAQGWETVPFLRADRIHVDLPWRAVGGSLGLEVLEADNPRVRIVRTDDGLLNLPSSEEGTSSGPLGPIRIGDLVFRNVEVRYEDRAAGLDLLARGIGLDMRSIGGGATEGRLTATNEIVIRAGERETRVQNLGARLRFDGTALSVEDFAFESPEGRMRANGKANLFDDPQVLDFEYDGQLSLERASAWASFEPPAHGSLIFSGRAQGSLDALTTAVDVSGDRLGWKQLNNVSVQARTVVSGDSAVVERFRVGLARGAITGEASIPLHDAPAGHARVRWDAVSIGELAAGLVDDLPARVGSVATGRADLEWEGFNILAGRWSIENAFRAQPSTRPALAISGRSELLADGERWTLSHDHRLGDAAFVRGSARGRVSAGALTSWTLDGTISMRVGDLSAALRDLRQAGVTVDADLAARLRGDAAATAVLAGTIASPRATGELTTTGLRFGATGPAQGSARFDATPQLVTIDPLQIDLHGNGIEGRATINLAADTVAGELTGSLTNIESLASELPVEWRPEGSAQVSVRFKGALDRPTAVAVLSSDGLRAAGQTIQRVQSTLRLANGVVYVDDFDLNQADGHLQATGRYDLSSGRYAVNVTGSGLTIDSIGSQDGTDPIPIEARFDLRLLGDGTLDSPGAHGFADFAGLSWNGYEMGSLRVDGQTEGQVMRLTANIPQMATSMKAEIGLDAPRRYTADLRVAAAALDRLLRSTGPAGQPASNDGGVLDSLALNGTASLHASAEGRLDEIGESEIRLLDLRLDDATVNGAAVRLERPARMRVSATSLEAEDLDLRIGTTSLSAQGALGANSAAGQPLRVSLVGSLSDLVPLMRLAPSAGELDGSGRIELHAQAAGAIDAPRIEADLAIASASLSSGTLPPISDVAVRASFAQGVLTVSDLRAEWQGATATGSGTVPASLLGESLPEAYRKTLPETAAAARATLRIVSLTERALSPFVTGEAMKDIAGRIDATLTLDSPSLDLDDLQASIVLDRAGVELARVPLSQLRPTRLRVAGGRLEIVDWTWAGSGNQLVLTGSAPLSDSSPSLSLAARGTIDLRMLGAFSPGTMTSGSAALDMTVTGTLQDPNVGGEIAIQNGGVAMRDPRLAVTDLKGVIAFAGDQLRLRGLTASANGGTLQIAGDVRFPEMQLAGGAITVTGRRLAFELPEHLRSEMDADLRLNLGPATHSLEGTVTVLRGSYREPISLTTQLLTAVQTRTASTGVSSEPSFGDSIALNIAVNTAEPVVIDNNYGRIEIGSDLRIVGTLSSPVPTGRLTLREGGDVFLGGHTYEVVRGTIDFTSATRMEPQIDLALETRVQRHEITLEVSGTPEKIEANLRSPGVSQADVISLLLTGQVAGDASIAQTDIARSQLLMLLSGEILGFAGRAVGLDSVQISRGLGGAGSDFDLLATDTDPSARLTISKDLRRDVELVFSQSLREPADVTWIAIYRPLESVEIRGATQDDGSRSYEFRHDVSFGAGRAAARRPADPIQTPAERVASVRILGMPGFDERSIRSQLRLREGNDFDFYRWQQDRDRLQRFYRDRSFLEATISARRNGVDAAPAGPSGLELTYDIDRGPLTTLAIEGYELPEPVRDRMEDAWIWAVFEGFLLEDLASIARDHLTGDGYLQAQVKAESIVNPDGAEKTMRVHISPGVRYVNRRIDFSGHEGFSTSVLDAVIEAGGIEANMWRDQSILETALTRYYQSQGYGAAKVEARPPVYTNGSATLPVHIEEGTRFVVASVEIAGAERIAGGDVREAFDIATGSPYRPMALESARRSVEVLYLREGYNDVRVNVTTLVAPDAARVDVVVTVDEGRQQILADIAIAGAAITNRNVVDRALALETGEPANLDSFYRAEKRLYDTGVFRLADIALEPLDSADSTDRVERVRAAVTLQELSPYRFRYGFRLNDAVGPAEADREVRPALVVDLLRRNLMGRAISTGIAGQIEADRRLVRGIVSMPRLFGVPGTTNFFLSTSREDFAPEESTPFVEDKIGFTAEQRFRPGAHMSLTYGYDYSHTRVFETEPIPGLPPLDLRANIGRLTSTYSWDRRNDALDAQTGWFHSSGVELGAVSLGSDLRFVKYLSQQYYFKTLRGGVVAASGFRLGVGRGFDQDLIPSEKFRAGGGNSVRGFAEDGLGPRDFFGDASGGNALVLFNQEIRFPIYEWVRGVAFLDAGNVFGKSSDFSLTDIEAGAGAGVRIHSPFALIRIDLGLPLTSRTREPSGRWYIGIGHAF